METVFTSTEAGCRAHNKTGNRKVVTIQAQSVPQSPTMLPVFGLERDIGREERTDSTGTGEKEVKVISFRIHSSSGCKSLINPNCSRGQYSCNDDGNDHVDKSWERPTRYPFDGQYLLRPLPAFPVCVLVVDCRLRATVREPTVAWPSTTNLSIW